MHAGDMLHFSLKTGATYALSTQSDSMSREVFTDWDNSLGYGGWIVEATGPNTWLLHCDCAISSDDDDNDALVQLRLDMNTPTDNEYAQLVAGLQEVTAGPNAVPGPMATVGGGAVAVVFGDADTQPLVQQLPPIVVGAGVLDAGRGVCFGHEGFLVSATNTLLDNEVLTTNVAAWLGRGGSRILFDSYTYAGQYGRQVYDGLVGLLDPLGYTVQRQPATSRLPNLRRPISW